MDPMNDLIAFLRARLDEDAAGAIEAGGDADWPAEVKSPGRWTAGASPYGAVSPNQPRWYVNDGHEDGVIGRVDPQGNDDEGVARHIARHDPARVLAEVDAKRRILAAAEDDYEDGGTGMWWKGEAVVRLLALPYADHADYRDTWRP